jgi:hypothetical protein
MSNHANVLTQVSERSANFITDLNNKNLGNDVVAATFSDWRKAGENANLGLIMAKSLMFLWEYN